MITTKNKKLKIKDKKLFLVSKGFTLIELLVVIFIIGILVGLLTVALQGSKTASRDARRKADLEDIRSALEIYRSDCGSYPSTLGSPLTGSCTGSSSTYMSTVPQDPLNSSQSYQYEYFFNSSSNQYQLCARLENSSGSLFACGGDSSKKCGTASAASCNYKAVNP